MPEEGGREEAVQGMVSTDGLMDKLNLPYSVDSSRSVQREGRKLTEAVSVPLWSSGRDGQRRWTEINELRRRRV